VYKKAPGLRPARPSSKLDRQFIIFWFQVLHPGAFYAAFIKTFHLHRLTRAAAAAPERPHRRVIEHNHSTDIGAALTFTAYDHAHARRRMRIFNVGRELVLKSPYLIIPFAYRLAYHGREHRIVIDGCFGGVQIRRLALARIAWPHLGMHVLLLQLAKRRRVERLSTYLFIRSNLETREARGSILHLHARWQGRAYCGGPVSAQPVYLLTVYQCTLHTPRPWPDTCSIPCS